MTRVFDRASRTFRRPEWTVRVHPSCNPSKRVYRVRRADEPNEDVVLSVVTEVRKP